MKSGQNWVAFLSQLLLIPCKYLTYCNLISFTLHYKHGRFYLACQLLIFIFIAQTSVSIFILGMITCIYLYLSRWSYFYVLYCFVFHTKSYCRSELKKLIVRLNEEKKILKEEGITVDGILYKVSFKGTQERKGSFLFLVI